ncbi:LysR family transcriptional regulator [Streptomyces fuscichromogenes]|uniref:LysR family transcriptional regulator n=1 Tax=Streptomyces fuscichromogenes TaxID=1324013 RepID=A0A917XQS3_9ACTN|nr:LysR family transcriptional regulator [Streptomyces fuscichromogenes]GGN46546.1 LysR family transcriptional regulator [Streptomyces fuscichromogenes]
MEIRQLRYFVAVAEELSFTRAASRLFAAQSTVSAGVRALEEGLQASLFERSTRTVALSPAGAAFLPEAKAVIAAAERASEVVGMASNRLQGSLRIGTMTRITALDLPRLVGAFRQRHPLVDIHIQVSGSGSGGIAEDVRRGRLDLGVVALKSGEASDLDLRPFATIPYVVILPAEHPLAQRESISLEDLAGENFVDGPSGFGSRAAMDRAFTELGLARRISVEITDIATAASYVRAIGGAAVMPHFQAAYTAGVVVKPLSGSMHMLALSFAVRAGRAPSPAVSALLDLSCNYTRDDGRF